MNDDYQVVTLPVGPESRERGMTVLFEGPRDAALAFYEGEREKGGNSDQAIAILMHDGGVLYACS